MNAEFFVAIEALEKEKGISRQYMYDKIHQAMMAAFRKDNPEAADNIVIDMNEAAKSLQSCLTPCDPMDCSLPGSSVHGFFQARTLERGAIAFLALYLKTSLGKMLEFIM